MIFINLTEEIQITQTISIVKKIQELLLTTNLRKFKTCMTKRRKKKTALRNKELVMGVKEYCVDKKK